MGHVLDTPTTGSENVELHTEGDGVGVVSCVGDNNGPKEFSKKWPPPQELCQSDTILHDPALDGNCLFNSFIFFLNY